MASKTLSTFVKDECANYNDSTGGCIYGGTCPVLEGQRCKIGFISLMAGSGLYQLPPGTDYFQMCVAPVGAHKPWFADAGAAYLSMLSGTTVEVRRCRCGQPLPKRRRLCESCGKKARRLSQIQSRAQARQLTPKTPSQPLV